MRTLISLIAILLLSGSCLAQDNYRSNYPVTNQASSFRVRMPQSGQRYQQRLATRPEEMSARSVLGSDYYPAQDRRSPEFDQMSRQPARQTFSAPAPQTQPRDWNPVGYAQTYQEDHGYYPFVVGDIFGVNRDEICDEWKGHCACLELTNWRSNCGCTNSRRGSCGQEAYECESCFDGGGEAYSYSASRTPVSDYFRSNKRR